MRSVVIVGFDGLQPAEVTPDLMPHLSRFAREGASFDNHHAVFPTVTRINAASMVTGCHPGSHGLAANFVVMRDYDENLIFSALEPTLAKVAKATNGRTLLRPTMADLLSKHGMEFIAVGTGTSGNAYVQNPNAERIGGAVIHPEFCLPHPLNDEIVRRFGRWPEDATPNTERLERGVTIFTEYALKERQPAVAMLWFSEPDHANHKHGPGHAVAGKAINAADAQFGRLLEWLERNGRSGETDVFVISDHGYSTITGAVDVETHVRAAGFPPGDQPDGVHVAPNGSSASFYVKDGDREVTDRLAEWLMAQEWCGPLLASNAAGTPAGTLPASVACCEGPRAPELIMSMQWHSGVNAAGLPGHAYSITLKAGQGMHGSISPHDLHGTLIARGPSFKSGARIASPSGQPDLAPTVLRLLGVPGDADMDGRVLAEALRDGVSDVAWDKETHRAERRLPDRRTYRQEVTVSRAGGALYVDEGRSVIVDG